MGLRFSDVSNSGITASYLINPRFLVRPYGLSITCNDPFLRLHSPSKSATAGAFPSCDGEFTSHRKVGSRWRILATKHPGKDGKLTRRVC